MRVLVIASLLLFTGCIYPVPGPDNEPEPVPAPAPAPAPAPNDLDAPSPELQSLVAPLATIITDKADAEKTAQFFTDFADVVERDSDVIKTTKDLRDGYVRAETLMLQRTDMVGKYPGFGAAKDEVLAEAIGLDQVTLTPEKRTKAVDVFNAMAWALRSGG